MSKYSPWIKQTFWAKKEKSTNNNQNYQHHLDEYEFLCLVAAATVQPT